MTASSKQLANDILHQLPPTGSLVVFVGSGLSRDAGVPEWSSLLERPEFADIVEAYPQASELALPAGSMNRIVAAMRERIHHGAIRPTLLHHRIAQLRPQAIITTNYDDLLERALVEQGVRPVSVNAPVWRHDFEDAVPLVKLHGTIDSPDSVVLNTAHWYRAPTWRGSDDLLALRALLNSSVVLALGYALDSPDLAALYERFGGSYSSAQNWFIIAPHSTAISRRIWRNRGVQVVTASDNVLLKALSQLALQRHAAASATREPSNKRVFVSHTREDHAVLTVKSWLRMAGLEPVAAETVVGSMDVFNPRLQEAIDSCVAAVVVMGSEPDLSNDSKRHNAAFEIGYLFARFGPDRVLVIASGSARPPVDITSVRCLFIDPRETSDSHVAIDRWASTCGIRSRHM